jgi:hypothetical protein
MMTVFVESTGDDLISKFNDGRDYYSFILLYSILFSSSDPLEEVVHQAIQLPLIFSTKCCLHLGRYYSLCQTSLGTISLSNLSTSAAAM